MLRQIKPRSARSKRALEKRAPKEQENPKTALFLRGTTCSQLVQNAMADLFAMRASPKKKFTKKNTIHPFEDATSLEFLSEKNDASLLCFGSSSKKRPGCLTLVRTFGHKVLDMLELYVEAESYRSICQFKTRKLAVGMRPMLVFSGTLFENPVGNEYTLAKSLLVDFLVGDSESDEVDVEGLQYVVAVGAEEAAGAADSGPSSRPALHLRVYLMRTKRSGQKLPRVELDECGPRLDFRLGRMRDANQDMMRESLRRAKREEKTKKNISTDVVGDKVGRVHLGKQDLKDLQTRKMKGLKRGRNDEDGVDDELEDGTSDGGAKKPKQA